MSTATGTMKTEELLKAVERGGALAEAEAEWLLGELLQGRLSTAETVRLLEGWNERAPNASELAALARTMRRHARPVFVNGEGAPEKMVDTCGTGGDGCGTFNISTAAAIVAAAAGARVAKHGNRSSSSRCGSADVLEALGVRIDVEMERCGAAIREVGIGFLFAPAAHTAARHAAAARKQIGRRTVFNLLGPLTNPAGAQRQVLGVYSREVMELVAETLARLGTERALVVHGAGGMDEFSIAGETEVVEVQGGRWRRYSVAPEEFGVRRAGLETICGGSPQENAETIQAILAGEEGPRGDVVVMNAAAALVVTDVAADFAAGAKMAREAIASGRARKKLEELGEFTKRSARC